MRFKIQEFTYNEETGESTMMAVSEYGNLYSSVRCAEEDKDVQNQWDAYRFCEYKIAIEYCRYWVMALKNRYEAIFDAYKTIEKNFYKDENIDYQPYFFYLLEKQAKGYKKVYHKIHNQYLDLKGNYKSYCNSWLENRRKLREKIKNMRGSNPPFFI